MSKNRKAQLSRATHLSIDGLDEFLPGSHFIQNGWERVQGAPWWVYIRRDMIPSRIVHHRNTK